MRSNPQETGGSRFRLRYSVRLAYEVAAQSAFLLCVHAAKTAQQFVLDERFELTPPRRWSVNTDPWTRNRIAAFEAPAGSLTIEYEALVDIEHRVVEPLDVKGRRSRRTPRRDVALHPAEPVPPGRSRPEGRVGQLRAPT